MATAKTMRAAFLRRFGGPEVLEVGEMPRPVPKADEVLIAVHAASINPRDWLIREGRYPFQRLLPKPPFIPGSDVSGVVDAVGGKVRGLREGDEVFAMQPSSRGFGGYAEWIAVPAQAVVRKPANLSHVEAAAVPLAALTALQALRDCAGLNGRSGGQEGAGEANTTPRRVLINGASGGVGSFAVQIAKIFGAEVLGVCSTRNLELVRQCGADQVFDYTQGHLFGPPQARHPGIESFHVVFDVIGKESLKRCAALIDPRGGVYVTTIPRPPAFREWLFSSIAMRLGLRSTRASLVLVRSKGRDLAILANWITQGKLRPHVDRIFPLESVAEAQRLSRTFRTRGKLVLKIR